MKVWGSQEDLMMLKVERRVVSEIQKMYFYEYHILNFCRKKLLKLNPFYGKICYFQKQRNTIDNKVNWKKEKIYYKNQYIFSYGAWTGNQKKGDIYSSAAIANSSH